MNDLFPSSFSVSHGNCYSTLPHSVFAPTGGCYNLLPNKDLTQVSGTYTFPGETITGELESFIATIPVTTKTTTFDPVEATGYVGVAVEGAYILVHQKKDIKSSAVRGRGNGKKLAVAAIAFCFALSLIV
jgi:hypothetical protein